MSKKTFTIIATILILIAIAVAVLGVMSFSGKPTLAPVNTNNNQNNPPANNPVSTTSGVTNTPAQNPLPVQNPPTQKPAASTSYNITIQNFSFNPSTITIKAGDKVIWKNNDPVPHSIVGDNFQGSTGAFSNGGEFSMIFGTAGEYNYHCGIHPSMQGKIIVK
jgi:plastocyanin